MLLNDKKVLLTGATGGIGQQLVRQLAAQQCQLVISGRSKTRLDFIEAELRGKGFEAVAVAADISNVAECKRLVEHASDALSGLDVLINLAGWQCFGGFADMAGADIDRQILVNLSAPIHLARAAVRVMLPHGSGHIVNIGSTFGSIGFANFSVYSASKFGLRGFSEALRRELCETGIKVVYVAPRATRTDMNSQSVYAMAEETGMNMDDPGYVAAQILKAVSGNKKNHHIGYPEKIFARINSLVPGWVDRALARQDRIASKYI